MSEADVYRKFMDALQLKFFDDVQNKYRKAPVLDPFLCLGCGVCVHKCPTDSLTLERREEIHDPPENVREYAMRFMEDRKAGVSLTRKDSY
jgi:formate hydrogenlyase subunit 6/NADH:ubiquinone oxidoreductase subunit I